MINNYIEWTIICLIQTQILHKRDSTGSLMLLSFLHVVYMTLTRYTHICIILFFLSLLPRYLSSIQLFSSFFLCSSLRTFHNTNLLKKHVFIARQLLPFRILIIALSSFLFLRQILAFRKWVDIWIQSCFSYTHKIWRNI